MSSPPSRRTVLRGVVALCPVAGGCVSPGSRDERDATAAAETPSVTGSYADRPDGPEQYPSRPDEPTRDAAVAFAEAFERTRVANSLFGSDVEAMEADARAVHDTAAHGGHYVLATGSGYANYADGLHADWGQAPALFFVSPSLVVRVADYEHRQFHCTDVYAAEDPDGNYASECRGAAASYRVYNVAAEPHDVSVTVEFLGADGPTTVLERTYAVGYERGVEQGSVTRRRGRYRLTAGLADGPSTTSEWELPSPDRQSPVAVLVTPVGGVTVRRLAFAAL